MAAPNCVNSSTQLKIMSYNMHGFYQGCSAIDDTIIHYNPDLIFLQEHWLTPANLFMLDNRFTEYFCFGCSAMSTSVETGMLRGRPFGGVAILIKNSLRKVTRTIHCSDRYAIVKVNECLFVNIYLPCSGTTDRQLLCDNILSEIDAWLSCYHGCGIVIAGDFNVNLSCIDSVGSSVHDLANSYSLVRCDELFPSKKCPTYVNAALGHESIIDYILVSRDCVVKDFCVTDSVINFSDHLPLLAKVSCPSLPIGSNTPDCKARKPTQLQLRWDKADTSSFYYHTGNQLNPLLIKLDETLSRYKSGDIEDACDCIDELYYDVVNTLVACAKNFVPVRRKCYYKFWWDEGLDTLKEAAIESDRLWKAVGKPRFGTIFDNKQHARMQYRKRIREGKRMNDVVYSNELNDALLRKDSSTFWKCWRSKFEPTNNCTQIDGCVDDDTIVEKFAAYFSDCYSCNSVNQKVALMQEYNKMRENYCGFPCPTISFDTELVSKVMLDLKRGKAADIDGLSNEHLLFSHPVLPVILSRLFDLILCSRYIPFGFKQSYIVPIPKVQDVRTKAMTCNDFRGIAISPVIAKVFEYCFLSKFQSLFATDKNQFGFKKGISCSNAIYSVRKFVDRYVTAGCTVNLCAIDLSKAFDKVNHHALFIKLMKRHIPIQLLEVLENLFYCCYSYVKWNNVWSSVIKINLGVRQGSVLSPFLFALYLDDLSDLCSSIKGCGIVLYADDILLLSTSITQLERLLHVCESELTWLDMSINFNKSCCIRIGPRCDIIHATINSLSGHCLPWVTEMRYLGIYIVRSRSMSCSLDSCKRKFYRAANSIFGKIGRTASEEVVLHLVKSKCMPILLYGLEALSLYKYQLRSLDFVINRFCMKLFRTTDIQMVAECQSYFGLDLPSVVLARRSAKFLDRYRASQ